MSVATVPGNTGNWLSLGNLGGVTGVLGDVGNLLGLGGGLGQSKGMQKLLGSAQTGLNQNIAQEQALIGDTTGFAQSLGAAGQGYNTAAAGYAPLISGAGTALTQNPYLSPLANYAQAMAPGQNQYLGQLGGAANRLANYNALTPQQIALLTTQAGNAAKSAAATMASQTGGVPNQAALMQSLVDQAGGVGANAAVQLGAQVGQEQLGALQDAASLYGTGGNLYLSSLGAGAGTIGQAGSQYLQGYQGAGNLYAGAGGLLSGIGATDISGANVAYGTSLGGLQNINQQYQQLIADAQQGGGSGGFNLGSLASLGGLFG